MQKRMWDDLARIREEYERLIHNELRVIRQRAMSQAVAVQGPAANAEQPAHELNFDSLRFADRFRGTSEYVKENQRFYLPYFQGLQKRIRHRLRARRVSLCPARSGDLPRKVSILATSVSQSAARKGFQAEKADLFPYLDNLPHASLDGIFCGQVVEHLQPERLPDFIRLAAQSLAARRRARNRDAES